MKRIEAIEILARHNAEKLTPSERDALLNDWWTIDETDLEYPSLSDDLMAKLAMEGPDDPADPVYDSLVLVACRRAFLGVLNSFLEGQLVRVGCAATVSGSVEELSHCPCCHYRSLTERNAYQICKVCFWEDDGTTDLDRMSPPNHLTLREAQENFSRLGAVIESAVSHVLPDGRDRYAK